MYFKPCKSDQRPCGLIPCNLTKNKSIGDKSIVYGQKDIACTRNNLHMVHSTTLHLNYQLYTKTYPDILYFKTYSDHFLIGFSLFFLV